jgi:RES domain-containing protein
VGKIKAWRITSEKYAGSAFSGEGAEAYGGRFNSVGTPVVYTSASLALATLELLAKLNERRRLANRVCIPVVLDEGRVVACEASGRPDSWDARPYVPASQEIGDRWVGNEESLVLRVPSVVALREHNDLIPPEHPDVEELGIGESERLDLNLRILR